MAKYICKNFGACGKADAKEEIDVLPGTEAKCPECGSSLHETGKPTGGIKTGGGMPKWAIPAVLAVLVLVGGGGYYTYNTYIKKPIEVAETAVGIAKTIMDIAKPSFSAAPSVDAAPTSLRPDETEIQTLKKEGETKLVKGDASGAESASRRAATLEMIKTAIAYMAKGDLAKAESELNTAQARAPDEPLVYYNLAVVRIKQQRNDDALVLLETTFTKGFKGLAEMERDSDMAPLRKDARYQALLSKYRKG